LAGEEKTEKATPKKRKDAREKEGNVLQSKEINTAVSVLGIFLALMLFAQFMFTQLQNAVRYFLTDVGAEKTVNNEFFTQITINAVKYCVLIVGPVLLAAILLGTLPTIVQTKGLFTMKPLRPKFSKLNPLTGIKRLFSIQSAVNVLKGIIEIIVVCIIVYTRIMGIMPLIKKLPQMEPIQAVAFIASNTMSIVLTISMIFAFIAAGDYIFQWWQYEKKLRMSKQEIKDEYKQIEGDPLIKSKIKQKQREIAQNRMMQDVPGSDVVVRNPTHYAVALKYDTGATFSAPKVVAKGQDAIALKIIEIAEENGVPVTEDRPLARALHDAVKVGGEIPHSLYTAVASIFAELEDIKKKIDKKIEIMSR